MHKPSGVHLSSTVNSRRTACRAGSSGGFSLIEALLAVAILTMASLGIASLISAQSREIRSLSEKILLNDVKTRLTQVLGKADLCHCLLKSNSFNTTRLDAPLNSPIAYIPETYIYPLPTGNGACNDQNVGRIVPRIGQKVPGTNLEVETIEAKNFANIGGGDYLGELEIKFRQDSMVRLLKPVTTPITISVNPASGTNRQRPISSCATNKITPPSVMAFYEPNYVVLNQTVIPNQRLACTASRVAIEFGGSFHNDNPYNGRNYEDSRGYMRLYVDNVMVADRKGGGRVGSGGDLTDAASSIHGMWVGNCNNSIVVRLRFENTSSTDQTVVNQSYIKVNFFDP